MVHLGDTRIQIIVDDDFDYTLRDWDESIRSDVRQHLDNGEWEAYKILIQRAVPGSWKTVESLCGSVHSYGLSGVYRNDTEIPDSQMRETVLEMFRNIHS